MASRIILLVSWFLFYISIFAWHIEADVQEYKYNRKDWKHWIDEDGDGQDTRQEVLIEESLIPVIFNKNGKVQYGMWLCLFTGQYFTNSSQLDIDHVVPLKHAHDSGGYKWSAERKMAFANELDDPNHLIAVSKSANRSKGSKSPLEWLPPNEDFWCEYISIWISIKDKWELEINPNIYNLTNSICNDNF